MMKMVSGILCIESASMIIVKSSEKATEMQHDPSSLEIDKLLIYFCLQPHSKTRLFQ